MNLILLDHTLITITMGFFKKSTKSKTAHFTSTDQPKVTVTTNENPATQDDLKKTPTAATVEISTMKEQFSNKETQPADGTTEQGAPKEGELNTETMIQVLRSKLGLQDMCDGDGAELTSLDDDMSNTSNEEEVEEPVDLGESGMDDLLGKLGELGSDDSSKDESSKKSKKKDSEGELDDLMDKLDEL